MVFYFSFFGEKDTIFYSFELKKNIIYGRIVEEDKMGGNKWDFLVNCLVEKKRKKKKNH